MSEAPLLTQGRKEYKDEQLLARLIGAAVLLAIAVIVLPFVLDGAGSQREYEYADTFPVQPERPIAEKSFSSRQPLPQAPKVEDLPVVTTVAAPIAPVTATNQSVVPDPLPVNDTAQPVVVANPVATTVANREVPVGFNIQVASFVKDVNALKLLNRLQRDNLPAYINRIDGKKRAIFRVFAGPLTSQIDALALKNRIDRKYRVDSIMVTRN